MNTPFLYPWVLLVLLPISLHQKLQSPLEYPAIQHLPNVILQFSINNSWWGWQACLFPNWVIRNTGWSQDMVHGRHSQSCLLDGQLEKVQGSNATVSSMVRLSWCLMHQDRPCHLLQRWGLGCARHLVAPGCIYALMFGQCSCMPTHWDAVP